VTTLGNLTKDDRILILSPHLDDAVLSAGGLIDLAVKQQCAVIVGNIFTADARIDEEPSQLVKELHAWWGLGSNPYRVRRKEDAASLALLGADVLQGGLLDSIYRMSRRRAYLYPTRQAVFSAPAIDDPAWKELKLLLAKWLADVRPTVILCPMAVGRHVDHVVTTEALRKNISEQSVDVYLYEDIPYAAGFFPPKFADSVPAARERSSWEIGDHVDVAVDFAAKFAAVLKYQSQIAEIFPGLDPETELRRYMRSDGDGAYRERFWRVASSRTERPANVLVGSQVFEG